MNSRNHETWCLFHEISIQQIRLTLLRKTKKQYFRQMNAKVYTIIKHFKKLRRLTSMIDRSRSKIFGEPTQEKYLQKSRSKVGVQY